MTKKTKQPTNPQAAKAAKPLAVKTPVDELPGPDNDEEPVSDDDEDDDEEDPVPAVVIATVADMVPWITASVVAKHGSRPVWFHVREDADLIGLFQRYPEGLMPKSDSDAILAGLRAFSLDQSEALQLLLGVTDSLQYGFHVDASLEDVIESFEDDGFDVLEEIEDGKVTVGRE